MSDEIKRIIDPREVVHASLATVSELTGTTKDGLTHEEAAQRLATYGSNEITEAKKAPLILKLLANFYHLMAILLWVASILSFIGGLPELAWAIIAVIVVNAFFSFIQEFKAEKATEALKKLVPLRAKVIRAAAQVEIAAQELVPGDLVVLEDGDKVSADSRVIEDFELRVDNSTLTGESKPIRRTSDPTVAEEVSLSDATNVVFAGTNIVHGSGKAIVFATGMQTEFGKIARFTQAIRPELSPLQKQINHGVRIIAAIAVLSGFILFLIGSQIASLSLSQSFTFAIGMIVANMPEGLLPTVTLSLAVGVQRLVKRHALVKKLSSVETLGSTDVICTDKTGTLTQNEMTVRTVWSDFQSFSVDGVGYEPVGSYKIEGKTTPIELSALQGHPLMHAAMLCNNSRLLPPDEETPKWHILGDPTEAALTVAAKKTGINEDEIKAGYSRIYELPFDSRRKRMTTINLMNSERLANIKGAPKEVLDLCDRIYDKGNIRPLTDSDRDAIIKANDDYSRAALRVIAFAHRSVPSKLKELTIETVEANLIFLGLMAMLDPPRPEVQKAIKNCDTAGIRVIMITGDYGITAESIARRIGLVKGDRLRIIAGSEIDALSDDQLKAALHEEVLFARVSPEHKMKIAAALKQTGHIVAMTGDGVNDAPALKQADIGVAMGITGTDVAKEASEMIITDDNFASIISAIEEGRAVYDNMQKFITYIFAHLTPEIIPFILFVLMHNLGVPLGITVLQILAIDLGTETIPALALGVEKPEPGIMTRPPRPKKERLIGWPILYRGYIFLGIIESLLVTPAFFWILFQGGWTFGTLDISKALIERASTMTFLGIVTCQIGTVFACRTNTASVFRVGFFSNRLVLIGIAFEVLLTIAMMYIHPIAEFLGMAPLGITEWAIALTFPPIVFLADELRKALNRRHSPAV